MNKKYTTSPSEQPAHYDRLGYPSCSTLGTQAGQNALSGSGCPPSHSKSFCNDLQSLWA
jgi:hypothetical protein